MSSAPKRIKCIDNGGDARGHLVEGQVYQSESEDATYYCVKGTIWLKRRFEVVVEEEAPTATTQQSAAPIAEPTPTPAEEKPFDFDSYNRTPPGRHLPHRF